MSCRACWTIIVAAQVTLPSSSANAADNELEVLRAAHRAAKESIRTFSAKITVETILPKKNLLIDAQYWRSFDDVRIRETWKDGTTQDYLLRGSEIRIVGSPPKNQSGVQLGAGIAPRSKSPGLCDVWTQMLLEFSSPDGKRVDLDGLLELAKKPPQIDHDRFGGAPCLRLLVDLVDADGRDVQYVTWHDATRNHLVRKFEIKYTDNRAFQFEAETEFVEFAQGVHVPCKSTRRTKDGNQVSEETATLSDLRVNEAIPESVFELPPIPEGTLLSDSIRGTRYTVDRRWQRIGTEKPFQSQTAVENTAGEKVRFTTQSRVEQRSWTRLLLPSALGFLIVAVLVALWRQRRSPAQE